MNDLISKADLEQITGAKRGKEQADILRRNGIRFVLRNDGHPSLTWEAYNRQLASQAPSELKSSGPNLHAI